ncbi:hypothetical protein PG990_005825 [Apiospora arundinis]
MGIVSSRLDDGAAIYLKDQNRLSVSSLVISNPRRRSAVTVVPNAYPATRATATRTAGDGSHVEFVQDIEPSATPNFLLKLNNEDELVFNFTFVVRQEAGASPSNTNINGLTYVYASTAREVENLVTREFHADPNLHKNSNVELVGDFRGGWRTTCSFVEYDPRAHKLVTLASFSFWVANTGLAPSHPSSPSPVFQLAVPPKIRVASAQSVDSRISEQEEPGSPLNLHYDLSPAVPTISQSTYQSVKVDVACPRPGDDMTAGDDGPVFRATMKALEQKTGNMRAQMKKVLKKADHAYMAQTEANDAFMSFIDALREASSTNANAVQPALNHYFDHIAKEIVSYERQNAINLQKIIVEPVSRLYTYDIKQAESKKRDFEEESKDYYNYVSRYLGQRQDSVKTKKLADSDTKYQTKRRNFELKRFDYSSFMQDLHGGRKEQEVLSHLTRYADAQARGFLNTAKKIDNLLPQLEALSSEVQEADKEFQYQRREREEKRRVLEKSNLQYNEPESVISASSIGVIGALSNGAVSGSEGDLGRADSTGSQLRAVPTGNSGSATAGSEMSRSPGSLNQTHGSPAQNAKFKGIRDLEERDFSMVAIAEKNSTQRKEGLLWALNRPGSHVDPRALTKQQGWHKFWVVLDQGKLSEYSNWKQKLDLHMDPIDLRMASVREARNAERRFCFEVITPQYKRVYQATSDEDMNSWIVAINNALQSAVEGHGLREKPSTASSTSDTPSLKRDIGSILTGKSISLNHGHSQGGAAGSGVPLAAQRLGLGLDSANGLRAAPTMTALTNFCNRFGTTTKATVVRSLTLDITSFTPDIIELLMLVGNRVSNMVWESRLEPNIKPGPGATREQRLRFITAKYVDKAFVEPISATLSRYPTADETLLAAIKRSEIQQVIYALALKANPNVLDKSRGTHPVFLALAAADPASPSPTTPSATDGRPESSIRTVPFPIAEMLVQNGAEIPNTMPAIPLSRSAQLYIEQKRGRAAAIEATGPSVGSSSLSPSPSERLPQRDKDRLQKRISAGGRLARSPIAER